jgi:hypothetical protein
MFSQNRMFIRRTVWPQLTFGTHMFTYLLTYYTMIAIADHFIENDLLNINRNQAYFSVQLITICAVVNLKCAVEKANCAVINCAVVNCCIVQSTCQHEHVSQIDTLLAFQSYPGAAHRVLRCCHFANTM